jgi:hypothetical protein
MSSFNIYDNYSSFSDLINRTEFLEEKTYKSMVKGANLGPELKKYRTEDGKSLSATSRIKNLILISALVRMDMLDEDVAKALRKKATSSTYITNTLKELAPKVHAELFDGDNPGSEKVVKYVQDNIKELLPFAVKNVTRGEFEIKEVDTEEPDDSEAKELEDEVSDEVKIAQGLMSSGADRVKLDFDDVDVNIEGLDNKEEVAAKIVELINTKDGFKAEVTPIGFNVEGPVGIFPAKKDERGNIIHTRDEVARDQFNQLIAKYFPSVSESEVKVTLNTNEEDYEYQEGQGITEPEETNEYAMGEEGDGITEVEDNEDEAAARKKPGGSNVGDYPNVSKDDFCGPAGGAPEGSYPVNSERRARAALSYAHNAPDPEGIKKCVYRKAKKHGWFDKPDEGEEDNEFDDFDIGPQSDENVPDDYEEVLKAMITKDKEDFAKNMIEDEEELQVESTTAAYLTEQKQSDKRNKKTEVKNQSFKERYKPKTHWQLEELRRYGL